MAENVVREPRDKKDLKVTAPEEVEVEVVEKYIYGNISDQTVILPDLIQGSLPTGPTFKIEPGQVVDLLEYFTAQKLKRCRSLKIAMDGKFLKKCDSVDEVITPKKRDVSGFMRNEFHEALDALEKKEQEDNKRLRPGIY